MRFHGRQRRTIWLTMVLALLLVLAAVAVMGMAAPSMLRQDATVTPAEETEMTPSSATATPAEETEMTVTSTPEAEATGTAAEDTAVTTTPADEAEVTTTATPAAEEETESTTTPTAPKATGTPVEESTATASPTPEPLSDEELVSMGEDVYASYCAACHQLDGQGITNAYPALAGDPFVTTDDPTPVLRLLFTGRAGMPHFRDYLTTQELAAAASYIRNGWGNDASVVTVEEVQSVRQEIYSPSEPSEHDGSSQKEGSNGSGNADQAEDSSQE